MSHSAARREPAFTSPDRGTARGLAVALVLGLAVALLVVPGRVAPAAAAPGDACPAGVIAEDWFVDTGGTFEAAIDCAWHWGITGGTSATHYSPAREVTREQMAAFISRLITRTGGTLPTSPPDAFPDDNGSAFQLHINQLAAVGIVAGNTAGNYEPAKVVTRAQMAAFLVRAYDYRATQGGRPTLTPGPDAFTDDDGHPMEAVINTAAAAGFAGGYADGTYQPWRGVRRDHMAAFLTRVLDLVVAQGMATIPPPPPPRVDVPLGFTVRGAGWGHGVGMSQYGAYAMARNGSSASAILRHYYTGTGLGLAPADDPVVRVQVRAGATSTTVRSHDGVARVRVGGSIVATPAAGTAIVLTPVIGGGIKVTVGGTSWTTASSGHRVLIEWPGTRYWSPTWSTDVTASVSGAYTYRHGRLEVKNVADRVNVVNVLRLSDEYMYGIAEMPSSWPAAALQAQAIAARTYAYTGLGSVKTDCDCHMYADTRSQVFRGWNKENETTWGARWKAAVDATVEAGRGRIVTRNGAAVRTFYFSSSGGRTQNSEDVWTTALPHLRSVSDPWSLDPAINPNASWTAQVTQASMANAFGLPNVVKVQILSRTEGGGVASVRATSTTGATATINGEQLRSRLGLKATWVSSIQG